MPPDERGFRTVVLGGALAAHPDDPEAALTRRREVVVRACVWPGLPEPNRR